jgi:hypothetical protein
MAGRVLGSQTRAPPRCLGGRGWRSASQALAAFPRFDGLTVMLRMLSAPDGRPKRYPVKGFRRRALRERRRRSARGFVGHPKGAVERMPLRGQTDAP